MYQDDQKNLNKEEKEKDCCLICWDNKNVFKMQSFVLVTNSCSCDSTFHGSCLFNWVHQTHSCPICRKPCQFNVKLLKFFLKNKIHNHDIVNPLNQIVEFDLENYNTGPRNTLFIIYKVTASLLKFIGYIVLYGVIISLTVSIRREMELLK